MMFCERHFFRARANNLALPCYSISKLNLLHHMNYPRMLLIAYFEILSFPTRDIPYVPTRSYKCRTPKRPQLSPMLSDTSALPERLTEWKFLPSIIQYLISPEPLPCSWMFKLQVDFLMPENHFVYSPFSLLFIIKKFVIMSSYSFNLSILCVYFKDDAKKKQAAKKKKKKGSDESAVEESDDGDEEGRELDYISDSSDRYELIP